MGDRNRRNQGVQAIEKAADELVRAIENAQRDGVNREDILEAVVQALVEILGALEFEGDDGSGSGSGGRG